MKKNKLIEQSEVKLKVIPGSGSGANRYSWKRKAHIINPENLHPKIKSSQYLKTQSWRVDRQSGHPKVIDVLETAVKKVHNYISLLNSKERPKFLVKDIVLI